MATTSWKVLGQSNPAATTDTTLYTVPASTQAIVRVTATNQGAAGATIRIAVRIDGAAISAPQYITYEELLPVGVPAASYTFTCDATDVVTVRASTATCNFVATGAEIA